MVELHVFTRGEVALLQRRMISGDDSQGIYLVGGKAAVGDFDSKHLRIGLALTVHTSQQTPSHELIGFPSSVAEAVDFMFKFVYLFYYWGDDSCLYGLSCHITSLFSGPIMSAIKKPSQLGQ